MIIEAIRAYYDREEKAREWDSPLRCSNAGKCARQLAYRLHGFTPQPLNFRSRMVFRLGDLIESDLVDALLNAYPEFKAGKPISKIVGGDAYTTYEQFEVKVDVGSYVLPGHLDGYIERAGKPYCGVDFKSCTWNKFDKVARTGDIGDEYLAQAHCYMKGISVDKFLFVWYNKNTSALAETPVRWNDTEWAKIVKRFDILAKSTKDNLPDREYEPSKGHLPWQCSYCPYNTTCYPSAILEFDQHGKPIFRV